jgi:hypothetical protein
MSTERQAGRSGIILPPAGSWRGILLAFLYLLPPIVYFCLGSLWLYEKGYLLVGIAGWLIFTILFSFLTSRWLKLSDKVLPPLDWEKPWTFAPRDAQAWQIVQDLAARGTDLSLEQLTRMDTYQKATEELARGVAACYYPKAENPLEKVPILDLIVAIELASEDLEALCRQVPAMDQLTPGHLKGLTKALGYAQTVNDIYNFAMPVIRPVSGLPRLIVQKLVAEPAWRQTKEAVQRWLFKAYINRLGMHMVELCSGRLRSGAAAYRQAARARYENAETTHEKQPDFQFLHEKIKHRELKLCAFLPGHSTKSAHERLGLWSHLAQSAEYQVAEWLDQHHEPLSGTSYLTDVNWSIGLWPESPGDILDAEKGSKWLASAQEWLQADLLLFDLRVLDVMHQLENVEMAIASLSQAYHNQPDWPVAPILFITEGIDRAEIEIPANLAGEVHFSNGQPSDNSKDDTTDEPPGHAPSPELATMAELALILPKARQRQLARELAEVARHSGIRRVAGQVAQAAGKAGLDMISGWFARRSGKPQNPDEPNQAETKAEKS